jgi:outer membrane PBP1 activator LpoA protein
MGMKQYYTFIKFDYISFVLILLFFLAACSGNARLLSQPVRVGVILPLFEDSEDEAKKQFGNEVLNGIKFSLSEYYQSHGRDVLLDVRDSKKDIETTISVLTELAENDSIICVLGPIYSNELAESADAAFMNQLPVISPTATGDDLADTHDYLFQLNPTYDVRGRIMADYLYRELKMRNFAIISEDSYGVNFADHFEAEVKKLGGNIAAYETYKRDAKNINDIIAELHKVILENDLFINPSNMNLKQREKLERSGVRYGLLDSLITLKTEVSIYYLFGRNAKKIIDTLNIKPYQLKSDSVKFIQGYFDAIYIPISNPSEIGMIVPELYSNGLNFFIAGTGDWNNEKALDENKVYMKNLIFESEYYLDENSPQLKELRSELQKTDYTLDKSFLFGYDSMGLILHLISEGGTTRQLMYNDLLKVSSYDAVKSKITLDRKRVNSELNILTYDHGLKRICTYTLKK